ncbi:MAG: mevalonate kinase [Nitrososphaerales archaeon]|nr:mevalonate kinase [Nitrososphaerales archaeon]
MKASAEAPCKAIITGEHFVVHGAWALAAALNRKVRVDVSESARFNVRSEGFRVRRNAVLPLAAVVEAMAREFSFKPSLDIHVSSGVPDGAGLGSSASTMVALAAALSKMRSLRLGVEELVDFAMLGEKVVHGRPSGVDVNICARGGVILFKMGERPRRVSLKRPTSFIVVFSGKKRSTRALISRVSSMKERYAGLFMGLTEAASEISKLAAAKLAEGDMEGLGSLLTFNHAVLSAVGASNSYLDGLVDTLLTMGCRGAKLTGAGGGGSVIAVPPRGKEKRTVSELRARGFEAFEARMPVEGVRSWLGR